MDDFDRSVLKWFGDRRVRLTLGQLESIFLSAAQDKEEGTSRQAPERIVTVMDARPMLCACIKVYSGQTTGMVARKAARLFGLPSTGHDYVLMEDNRLLLVWDDWQGGRLTLMAYDADYDGGQD